jgi:transmembrane sensor
MSDAADLAQRIERAAARIDPRLSDHDIERLVIATRMRGRRRAVKRIGWSVGALAVAAVALVMLGRGGKLPWSWARGGTVAEQTPSSAGPTAGHPVRFADGSLATPLAAGDVLVVAESAPERVRIDVRRGGGRFQVTPNRQRTFAVSAGPVTVTVLGTIFEVRRLEDRVGVTVERGTVRVAWPDGSHILNAGEDGWFATAAAPPPPPTSSGEKPGEGAASRKSPAPAHDDDAIESLLSAADTARAKGHPEEAVGILRRLLRAHAGDRRAPLAQLTLGRLLLLDLGRPREAAQVFAELRASAPDGPFAADALARETEAWARAGRPAEAHARALEYLRLYPDGNRAAAVRNFGGIE